MHTDSLPSHPPTGRFRLLSALLFALALFLAAKPATATAAPVYRLEVALFGLKVGEELAPWEGQIRILRPSPGDNFWYRLPHTVQVTGELPPGLRLVQKGAGFHDLARFAGTPTQAGQFTVQLQATMADGLTTAPETVTFTITDPRDDTYRVQTWGFARLRQGRLVGNAGAFLVNQSQMLLKAPTKVTATGLPKGLALAVRNSPGYYSLEGTPEEAGRFSAKLAFAWPDGAPVAELTVPIEVLPADYQAQQTLTVVVPAKLRQGVAYATWGFVAPFAYVEDEFGARYSGELTLTASGLPPGLSTNTQTPGLGFVVGRPTATGVFEATFRATLDDGTTTNEVTTSIEVQPGTPFADRAGSYDGVVERSETVNDSNGGRLRFTLTRTGQVTGFLMHKLTRYAFSSAAVTVDAETGELTITPPGAGVTVRGNITLNEEYALESAQPFFTFTGEVNDGTAGASVSADRATVRTSADPSPYAAPERINLVFVNPDAGAAGQPTGAGFLGATISPLGNVTVTVWAPDGSAPVSLATTLSETTYGATFPVYFIVPNSSGASTLSGSIFVNAEGNAAGELSWYQAATNRGAFPEGIALVEYTGVIGSRYTPEPAGLNLLGLEESIQTAQLDLIGEDVPTGPEATLTVQRSSMRVAPSAGARAVRMKHDRKTGVVSGSLTLPASTPGARARTVSFRGVRDPQGAGVIGHFTTPSSTQVARRVGGTLKIGAK